MRLLGLDVGEARIGAAISDPLGLTAQGRGFIERGGMDETLARLKEIVSGNDVEQIVVGLPLNMSGEEGESARRVRNFAERLRQGLNLPVVLWDERLTTAEAERLMKTAGLSRKKRSARLDQAAAQIILQSYLDSRG